MNLLVRNVSGIIKLIKLMKGVVFNRMITKLQNFNIQLHGVRWRGNFYGMYRDSKMELNHGYRRQNNNKE
jgi:hypothetical protein